MTELQHGVRGAIGVVEDDGVVVGINERLVSGHVSALQHRPLPDVAIRVEAVCLGVDDDVRLLQLLEVNEA